MRRQAPGKRKNLTYENILLAATVSQKNYCLCSRRKRIYFGRNPPPLAEINRCKSIKRTELFPIPGVQSSSRNSGGHYENQII
jgi:hypothetical protein